MRTPSRTRSGQATTKREAIPAPAALRQTSEIETIDPLHPPGRSRPTPVLPMTADHQAAHRTPTERQVQRWEDDGGPPPVPTKKRPTTSTKTKTATRTPRST